MNKKLQKLKEEQEKLEAWMLLGRAEALQELNIWIYHKQPTPGDIMVEIDKRVARLKRLRRRKNANI